jgi:ribosomal protein L31
MSALAVAVPAWAAKPPHPTHLTHPTHPSHPANGGGKGKAKRSCTALNKGYDAKGTLVTSSLTAASTKDRFDGSITVDVTRANHKAATGSQTFTLTNARVRFGKSVDSTAPAAGDRVTLHGKITVLPHGCSTTGFTPTITVRNVRIRVPKHA